MRLIFAGTPDPALPSLEAIGASRHELVAVLTRPDAPAGRGRRVTRSPVAQWADARGLPVLQPSRPGDPAFLTELAGLGPDCVPVVAYGALIPPPALSLPPHGWVNLHFSVLPAWRGAAPVQRALMAGDDVTGASTFRIEAGLDTGPVFGVLTERVRPDDTAGSLLERLGRAGASLLVATLDGIETGRLAAQPQPSDGVSTAPKVTVEEARVDWTLPAMVVDRRIRACTPMPGAWSSLRGERVKLGPVRPDPAAGSGPNPRPAPGTLAVDRTAARVGTGTVPVLLSQVQPQGRRPMPALDWLRGLRPEPGEMFR